MSDIGLNITVLDIFVYGVIVTLPLTRILLVILVVARLGIGHAATRRGLHWALNAGIIAVGPFGRKRIASAQTSAAACCGPVLPNP